MNISIVDVLNTGVTGFSFLMLYLGYKLTSHVQSKIFEKKINEFQNIEMYKEWKSVVLLQLNNTRYFLLFSLIFFVGGLLLLIYKAESKIILSVNPPGKPYMPKIYHQGNMLNLNGNGRVVLMVKDEHNIDISINELIKRIDELTFSLDEQKRNNEKCAWFIGCRNKISE